MKRRIFKIFFIIYTISLNYHHATGSGYLLFTKSELKSNETRYFLLDAQLDEENSQEQQLRFDAQNDTKFLLFTSRNSVNPQFIELGDRDSLLESNFNPGDPVRFIIHGFRDGPNAIVNSRGKRAYLEKGDFNVIVVDWSKGADTLNYLTAKKRIYSIGPIVSEFIEFMIETYEDKISLSNTYLIGHSLGAHLAGVVGKNMKIGKIPVIYGLDPAGPFFSINEPEGRLDKNDAEYVEVIHTDAGLQGLAEPMGTADFYPNYGHKQPGCGSDLDGACSHQRSAMYWAESINSETGFWSVPCLSYDDIKNKTCPITGSQLKMGGEPSNKGKASGVYYLTTASASPFALGPF